MDHTTWVKLRDYFNTKYLEQLNATATQSSQLAISKESGHLLRMSNNVQLMKHTYLFFKTNVIAACLKVTLAYTTCVYAYIYFECNDTKFEPKYYCTGPTYRSQDGEYRGRVLPWEQLATIKEDKLYSKWMGEVESSAAHKIAQGLLTIDVSYYMPMGCSVDKKKLDEFMHTSRAPLDMYCLCWVADYDAIYTKSIENHANSAYQYVFFQKEDTPIYKKMLDVHGRAWYDKFVDKCTSCSPAPDIEPRNNVARQPLRCGQKIFPLTAVEATKTNDIRFAVWREIYINTLASNLALNLISPSFPFVGGWFYIQNAHVELYDNIAMHEKYVHSEIATDISSQLKNLCLYNYVEQDRNKGAISGKFTKLARSINKAILYADSSIRLTDLAICVVGEHVGRTLRDIPMLIRSSAKPYDSFEMFSDVDIFAKHTFEFVYACLNMNMKVGVIHGDLHMNNTTINCVATGAKSQNEYCAYILDKDIYSFPYNDMYSMMIDFSKALIGSFEQLEREFGIKFADEYFREQRRSVMQTLQKYFPKTMAKYSNDVEALLLGNFPLAFKIISALDPYVLCSNMLAMMTIDGTLSGGHITIDKRVVPMLEQIVSIAEEAVVGNIKRAIDREIVEPSQLEWPNRTIINKVYADYLVTPATPKTRKHVDAYNGNNDLKYDIKDPHNWGPIVSIDELVKIIKEDTGEEPNGYTEWLEFKTSDDSAEVEKLREKYVSKESEVLQFEDWMVI